MIILLIILIFIIAYNTIILIRIEQELENIIEEIYYEYEE